MCIQIRATYLLKSIFWAQRSDYANYLCVEHSSAVARYFSS